jgi:hypothetical protein
MKLFLAVGLVCLGSSVLAQNSGGTAQGQPPPGTISSPSTNNGNGLSNTMGGNSTLTNSSGWAFTVEELGAQLQALRSAVDQTLPMLTSFNERYSAGQPGSKLGQAIQNIFSGNKNQGSTRMAGQEITNVLSALGSLVSTNGNQGTAAVNPNTFRDLETLQKDLQPVAQVLQNLSFTAGTNQTTAPVGGVPSPAGR